MHLHVLLQVRAAGELLLALVALEWLFSGVDALVPDQVGDL